MTFRNCNFENIIEGKTHTNISIPQFSNTNMISNQMHELNNQDFIIQHIQFSADSEQYISARENSYLILVNLLDSPIINDGYLIKRNNVLVLEENQTTHILSKNLFDALIININSDTIRDYIPHGIYKSSDKNLFKKFKETILLNCTTDTKLKKEKILKIVNQLLNSLIIQQNKIEVKHYNEYKKISKFIQTNYKENFTSRDLAEEFAISERTLRYVFEHTIGISPIKYIKNYKLYKLKYELLNNPNQKITNSIINSGLEHHSLVTRDFKKLFGKTPKEFIRA